MDAFLNRITKDVSAQVRILKVMKYSAVAFNILMLWIPILYYAYFKYLNEPTTPKVLIYSLIYIFNIFIYVTALNKFIKQKEKQISNLIDLDH